jgi:hypothetical protein
VPLVSPRLHGNPMLDRDPDQVGGTREAEFILHLAAIIRYRLVAETDRPGNLQHAVAFAEEPENFEIATRQILKGMRQRRPAGRLDGEQGEFLSDLGLDVVVPRGDAEDGERNLVWRRVLRHIAERRARRELNRRAR